MKNESVDLVYLDPPFNSNADYNVFFNEHSGERPEAQVKAFKDTWEWNAEAAANFAEAVQVGGRLAEAMIAFSKLIPRSDMLAYLSMMAPRLVDLRRVMKDTASIFLHCDPTASHYLKLLLDAIFGPENYRNEVVWRRTGQHNSKRRFGVIHDTIFFYSKTKEYKFRPVIRPYYKKHVESRYTEQPDGRKKFTSGGNVLTGAGATGGESCKPWRGFKPAAKGRHWAIPAFYESLMPPDYASLKSTEKLEALYQAKLVEIEPGNEWPIMVRYLDERDGMPVQDIWAFQPNTHGLLYGTEEGVDEDIAWLGPTDPERLGYQTQKPVGLLCRIIEACTDAGDTVLDPFCGCGTTVAAAQKLDRLWVGIDITHLAVNLIKIRLNDTFGDLISQVYRVVGEPVDMASAQKLANENKYQFQYWALGLVGARPEAIDEKKGSDKGIDGRLYLTEASGDVSSVIISVKGGHVTVSQIRDLVGVIEREKAAIGVFICIEEPTGPMNKEAADAGFYRPKHVGGGKHPRLQILTIAELLTGGRIDLPQQAVIRSFKAAAKSKAKTHKQENLF